MPTPLDAVQHSFDAQALTVCHVGPDTALHLQLRKGKIVVRIPTRVFVAKLRAKADDNGNAWPVASGDLANVIEFVPDLPGGFQHDAKTADTAEQIFREWEETIAKREQLAVRAGTTVMGLANRFTTRRRNLSWGIAEAQG